MGLPEKTTMIGLDDDLDQPIIDKLNHLIEIAYDGFNGYQTAAEHVENEEYAELFEEYAAQREEHARELTDVVNQAGGEPQVGGQISGTFHRAWIDIKAVVTDGDEAILAECVRGEEEALEAYTDLISDDLPEEVRELLRQQLSEIRIAYERVNELEAALEA
jgi:uncharacterized protein (TIGR02284 family)